MERGGVPAADGKNAPGPHPALPPAWLLLLTRSSEPRGALPEHTARTGLVTKSLSIVLKAIIGTL